MEKSIDVQGHRGARGLMPENTIPAFIKALQIGVTTLELDLAVTKDHQLLVSHEPYMNADISLDSMGQEISKESELQHNIYKMSYEQVKKYDVGSRFLPAFPDQEKIKLHKPLLSEVVEAVRIYSEQENIRNVKYNIEIKSEPQNDNVYHPDPETYSKLVYDFIDEKLDKNLVNVQSFDFRILQFFHDNFPEIELAVLIENTKSIDENLDSLGFKPQIYSSDYQLLDRDKVKYLQAKKMKVIPWTVNEESDIKAVLSWDVEGIISDFPDRVLKVISE